MKLNLACGETLMDGYINVDMYPNEYPAFRHRILPADVRYLPFKDRCIDEIWASHILEHILYVEAEATIDEWVRVLKPGGKITIIVPDMKEACRMWLEQRNPVQRGAIAGIIYGSHRGAEQHHKSAWDPDILALLLYEAGLVIDELYHCKYTYWLWADVHKPEEVT